MSEADFQLQWSALTDVGRFRKNNEDAFVAVTFDGFEMRRLGKFGDIGIGEGDCVFAVSDGMGGANAGEFASRIAVDKIAELMPRGFRLRAMGLHQGIHDLLVEVFEHCNDQTNRMGQAYEECKGMGATLSLGWFQPGYMTFCHVGDSRIYYLPAAGGIKQLTEDHTHVAWLVQMGRITPAQAKVHPQRNMLTQVLGGQNQNLEPQVGRVVIEPGDRFIFCSDGVTEGVGDRNLDFLVRTPHARYQEMRPADRLVKEAVANYGRDNATAVVVEIA